MSGWITRTRGAAAKMNAVPGAEHVQQFYSPTGGAGTITMDAQRMSAFADIQEQREGQRTRTGRAPSAFLAKALCSNGGNSNVLKRIEFLTSQGFETPALQTKGSFV